MVFQKHIKPGSIWCIACLSNTFSSVAQSLYFILLFLRPFKMLKASSYNIAANGALRRNHRNMVFFSMDKEEMKRKCQPVVDEVNLILLKKKVPAEVVVCGFEPKFNGNELDWTVYFNVSFSRSSYYAVH